MHQSGKRRTFRWVVSVVAFLVLAYVVSYCVLSLLGGYYYNQSGEVRYSGGLAATDLVMYQPRFLGWQPRFRRVDGTYTSRGNTLGYFYSPMIYLDRRFVHRTRLSSLFSLSEERLEWFDLSHFPGFDRVTTYKSHGVILPDEVNETRETR